MESLKIGVSGIRGVVGEGLTPSVVTEFAGAFGTWVTRVTRYTSPVTSPKSGKKSPKIVVGRDTRTSGEIFKHAVVSGLMATGCDVIDLGVCPTPSVILMTKRLHAHGGVVITASHNQSTWNGLKFIDNQGAFLAQRQMESVISLYERRKFIHVRWDGVGTVTEDDRAIDIHIRTILTNVDTAAIKKARFKVAIDCCNGTGGMITPRFLRKLGCESVVINGEPNGRFSHDPEPLPEHLRQLCSVVKSRRTDIGFAQDPDADRLAIVSEKGEPLGEENTLALVVKFLLSRRKGTVVINLSTSRAIDEIAQERGVAVVRTPVGEVNVASEMKRKGAIIGGEGNGGVIYPSINFCRDSLVGIALILWYMASSKQRISSLAGSIPPYRMVKKKVHCPRKEIPCVIEGIKHHWKNGRLNLRDGVRIVWKDRWVHIRPSNTEPVIRIFSEAKTFEKARNLSHSILDYIERKVRR